MGLSDLRDREEDTALSTTQRFNLVWALRPGPALTRHRFFQPPKTTPEADFMYSRTLHRDAAVVDLFQNLDMNSRRTTHAAYRMAGLLGLNSCFNFWARPNFSPFTCALSGQEFQLNLTLVICVISRAQKIYYPVDTWDKNQQLSWYKIVMALDLHEPPLEGSQVLKLPNLTRLMVTMESACGMPMSFHRERHFLATTNYLGLKTTRFFATS